jgi:aminoglycoside phosphotransferase (APT) family kinase protein
VASPAQDIEAVLDESGPDYEAFSYDRPTVGHQGNVFLVRVEYAGEEHEVVVKFQSGDPDAFALEPCLHDYVANRTEIPVPRILVFREDPDLDVDPYFVTERVEGNNLAEAMSILDRETRERVVEHAGRILGNLHAELGFEGFGRLALDEDDSCLVVDDFAWDFQAFFREMVDDYVDSLSDTPFADLQGAAGAYIEGSIDAVHSEGVPRLVHDDFRPANMLFDPEEAEPITAVLDWQFALAAHPQYHIARTEFLFIDPASRDDATRERLREHLYSGYREHREFEPDEQYRRARPVYHFATLLWRMVGFESAFSGYSDLATARAQARFRQQFDRIVRTLPEA